MNDPLNQPTKTRYYDMALEAIRNGRQGVNRGLSMGLDRGVNVIPNIQRGTYYVIGGLPASGKSSWALHSFMYSPLEDILSDPNHKADLKVYLFSFEITIINIIAKAIARRIWMDKGILVDVNYLLSKGRNWCSDEIYALATNHMAYFEPLQEKVVIFDEVENPTGINKYLRGELQKQGTEIKRPFLNGDGEGEAVIGFKPDDPNMYNIAIIDHVSLTKKERGFTTKANIDKLSEYLFRLRNTYGLTSVVTQQYNREVSNVKRHELKKLEPQMSDFKDSGNTTQDADVVIGIFNPYTHELPTWRKYDSGRLKDRLRGMCILKNRDGEAGGRLPLSFIGEIGMFKELPKADKMTEAHYQEAENLSKYK